MVDGNIPKPDSQIENNVLFNHHYDMTPLKNIFYDIKLGDRLFSSTTKGVHVADTESLVPTE